MVDDPGGGLNSAIHAGIDQLNGTSGDGPVAVLLGDLPTLTPGALSARAAGVRRHRAAFVPDAEGTGTVLLTARSAQRPGPAFGPARRAPMPS